MIWTGDKTSNFNFSNLLYLHVAHDELEEPSQGAAFLLYTRIHFSIGSEKSLSSQVYTSSSKKAYRQQSIEAFLLNTERQLRRPGGKSTFNRKAKTSSGKAEKNDTQTAVKSRSRGAHKVSVSRCYQPAISKNT